MVKNLLIKNKSKYKQQIENNEHIKEHSDDFVIECRNLNLWYDEFQALKNINMKYRKNKVTAIIGPSGCGKSTLLRCFNRMNDVIEDCRIEGEVLFNGKNLYDNSADIRLNRKKIGMIFQKPNPFPMSIYDNITYGPKIHKIIEDDVLEKISEKCLKRAVLWDEVVDRLDDSAMGLSGGQQQRLCIARALAVEPEVLLMDEPTASLDPIATQKIEDLILQLKEEWTVIIVTHNMQQAARISDYTAFMYLGEMIEYGGTTQIFENPQEKLTENYITGRFG
ncbi:MAG: phosphate ABC transporter ATP-binding protein [Promethearchaeota archaeon]|nr:MAG: phosphate ABC transporter ATP-binding protein [Candidatus Lokiarchaeota archaeon]